MPLVHRNAQTLSRFRAKHQDLIIAEARRMTDSRPVFEPMLPKAAEAYHVALDEHDTTVARDVFDRLYGKSRVNDAGSSTVSVSITFVSATQVVTDPER